MDNAYARVRRLLTLAALLSAALPIAARPLLVPPKQRLSVPRLIQEQSPGQYPTYYGVAAIDGDTLLVNARRVVNSDGIREEGVHLFQRGADGTWAYVKELHVGSGGPLLNGDLATVQEYSSLLVYERGAQGWAQTASIAMSQPLRAAIRIDAGSIYIEPRQFPQQGCADPWEQWQKVNGTWKKVATIGPTRCDDSNLADVNDGRALVIHRPPNEATQQPPADIYAQGTPIWSRVAGLPAPPLAAPGYVNWFGFPGTLSGNVAYIERGYVFRDSGSNHWAPSGHLVDPETELATDAFFGKMRGSSLFQYGIEQDYEIPSHDQDFPSLWHTLRIYRPRANGYFDYYARLNPDIDAWGWDVSEDGTRAVITSPPDNYGLEEPTQLYVFEIPDTAMFAGTQQDNFETGNLSKWTATVGQFSVASTNTSRVLRQSNISGDAKAYLTGIDWTDQSIEADIRPTEFGGTDRWFGLATRRTSDRDYYYASFRLPNKVSLRRYRNGGFTELANAFLHDNFVPGQSYRVRLESIGDQHVVFLNGFPVAHAKDSAFSHGHPGVLSFRTRFDADNVIVSSGTRLLARFDTYRRNWSLGWYQLTPGQWQLVNEPSDDVDDYGDSVASVLRQSDTTGDAKWFSKVALGNQVISTRVRLNAYGTTTPTQDAWAGIAAHVVDANNY